MPEGKQKLTLTVDGELVEAAHKLDLNISELTEQVLRGYTFDPAGLEAGATREQYKELISTMDPLLSKYKCSLIVGETDDPNAGDTLTSVHYSAGGEFYILTEVDDDAEGPYDVPDTVAVQRVRFLTPTTILKKFFAAIEKAKTQRKEEVEGLVLAKRIVEVLTEREVSPRRGTPKTAGASSKGRTTAGGDLRTPKSTLAGADRRPAARKGRGGQTAPGKRTAARGSE